MTVNLTAAAVRIGNIMAIPADGEDIDSASVALYSQKLLDGLWWASDNIEQFTVGGNVTPSADVFWAHPGASSNFISINRTKHYASGVLEVNGELVVNGVSRSLRRVQLGAASGSTSYSPDGRLVYFNGSGMGATYWRIDDPTDAAPIGSEIEFQNDSNPVPIQSPGGGSLGSIGSGQSMRCTKVASNSWVARKYSPT